METTLEKQPDPPSQKDRLRKGSEEELHLVMDEAKKIINALISKEKKHIEHFKTHHKIIFAFVIFFAINLMWYGMWDIVSQIPILNNPFVALFTGAAILIASGYFYENLISAYFNKKHKRHIKKNTD